MGTREEPPHSIDTVLLSAAQSKDLQLFLPLQIQHQPWVPQVSILRPGKPQTHTRQTQSARDLMPRPTDPEHQLASFLAKYTPEISAHAEAIRNHMRKLYPTALELVYDNYNALA